MYDTSEDRQTSNEARHSQYGCRSYNDTRAASKGCVSILTITTFMCYLLAFRATNDALFLLSLSFCAERNLNPKAACLKRREEEKAEDGPKLPGHLAAHIAHPHSHAHAHSQAPFPALPVRSDYE